MWESHMNLYRPKDVIDTENNFEFADAVHGRRQLPLYDVAIIL